MLIRYVTHEHHTKHLYDHKLVITNLTSICISKRKKVPTVPQRSWPHLGLRLFRLLGPKLHHQIHKPIDANDKDDDESCIPPTIILIVQIQRTQVVRTTRVLTYLASGAIIGIEQVGRGSHPALVG